MHTQSWWHFVCTEYHGQMVMSKHMLQNRIYIDGPIRTCSDNRHRSVLWRELGMRTKKSKQITIDFPALIDCADVYPRLKCSFFLFQLFPSFFLLQLFPGQSKTQNDTIHYVHNNAWPTFRNGIRNSTNVTPLALRFGFAPFKVQIWAMKWKKKKPAGLRANLNSDRCRNARWWLPGSVQTRWLTIRVILSGI